MNKDLVELAICLIALVIGGAGEELLAKVCGVGFPFLLMSCIYMAARRRNRTMFAFAVAAGAMEDALCSLPFSTSISFFALTVAFLHWTGLLKCTFGFAYPVYQLWLRMWTGGLHGGVFARFLVSIPLGAATAWVVWLLLKWLDEKGALDE